MHHYADTKIESLLFWVTINSRLCDFSIKQDYCSSSDQARTKLNTPPNLPPPLPPPQLSRTHRRLPSPEQEHFVVAFVNCGSWWAAFLA
jgi:hypothetical protein